jgi:peptidoglycan/xylan/chitin deacetylase (PgdA/CDA1 family)
MMATTPSSGGHPHAYPRGTPASVESVLKYEFDRLHKEAEKTSQPRVFMCTMHPKYGRRPHRAQALANFVEYPSEQPGVWFPTCGEIPRLAVE